MKSLLKSLKFDDINFDVNSSQQFATVLFDRIEDSEKTLITIFKDGKINQRDGNNDYNPSARRHSSCVYVEDEAKTDNVIKICTIQHKGKTQVEIHKVSKEEYAYMFEK